MCGKSSEEGANASAGTTPSAVWRRTAPADQPVAVSPIASQSQRLRGQLLFVLYFNYLPLAKFLRMRARGLFLWRKRLSRQAGSAAASFVSLTAASPFVSCL